MSRVYVIDPDGRPSSDWRGKGWLVKNPIRPMDAGLRIMEADTLGWMAGQVIRMEVHGSTAMRPLLPKPGAVIERWQVFEEPGAGWVAWVKRPADDDRVRREGKERQLALLIAGILMFVGAVTAAVVLIVLPQCQGVF